MEVIHQGYLLCSIGGDGDQDSASQAPQKVYVVMTRNELVCYSDNPAAQHFSKVNILASLVLKNCRVNDVATSRNPKSFEVTSTRDHAVLEFACPTNSVKFQWVKHLQVQTCAVAPSPGPEAVRAAGPGPELHQQAAVSRQSPVHFTTPGGQPTSKISVNRNVAAKVLTPVPRISYNMSVLDHATGHTGTTMSSSGNLKSPGQSQG